MEWVFKFSGMPFLSNKLLLHSSVVVDWWWWLWCQTVILLHTCYKKALIRPRHNSYSHIAIWIDRLCLSLAILALYHWTGNNIVFRYIVFYIVFCKLSRLAFWHAFNKQILIDWLMDWWWCTSSRHGITADSRRRAWRCAADWLQYTVHCSKTGSSEQQIRRQKTASVCHRRYSRFIQASTHATSSYVDLYLVFVCFIFLYCICI